MGWLLEWKEGLKDQPLEGQDLGQLQGFREQELGNSSGHVFWDDDPVNLISSVTHLKIKFPRRELWASGPSSDQSTLIICSIEATNPGILKGN